MYLCAKDYERANVEYACGILNHELTIPLLAHMALVRFLVRVNTLVSFQIPD